MWSSDKVSSKGVFVIADIARDAGGGRRTARSAESLSLGVHRSSCINRQRANSEPHVSGSIYSCQRLGSVPSSALPMSSEALCTALDAMTFDAKSVRVITSPYKSD